MTAMNFLEKDQKLSLDKLRNVLVRLEDTIIFALIERAQFKQNEIIYVQGAFPFDNEPDFNGSFLDYFLLETERIHARVRRYTSPDEYPFNDNLPAPVLPALDFANHLIPNKINVNHHVKSMYLLNILPSLCAPGDDSNHGSSATRDVECLQALSKRIHYGKFIAEAKFQADPEKYTPLIKARDTTALMALLTNELVEERLLRRLRRKAEIYGQEYADESDAEDPAPVPSTSTDGAATNGTTPSRKRRRSSTSDGTKRRIDLDMVVRLYKDFVIPLTKKVEVDYLLVRA
ncbi:chorismate mutase aro7 [Allomyces javanicus]|nr:chorismate mutase aro7 [Allomyces javanicus]